MTTSLTLVRVPAAVRDAPLIRRVAPADVDALSNKMESVAARSGDVIRIQDKPGTHLYFVVSGTIKRARTTPDGRQQLIALITAGEQRVQQRVIPDHVHHRTGRLR